MTSPTNDDNDIRLQLLPNLLSQKRYETILRHVGRTFAPGDHSWTEAAYVGIWKDDYDASSRRRRRRRPQDLDDRRGRAAGGREGAPSPPETPLSPTIGAGGTTTAATTGRRRLDFATPRSPPPPRQYEHDVDVDGVRGQGEEEDEAKAAEADLASFLQLVSTGPSSYLPWDQYDLLRSVYDELCNRIGWDGSGSVASSSSSDVAFHAEFLSCASSSESPSDRVGGYVGAEDILLRHIHSSSRNGNLPALSILLSMENVSYNTDDILNALSILPSNVSPGQYAPLIPDFSPEDRKLVTWCQRRVQHVLNDDEGENNVGVDLAVDTCNAVLNKLGGQNEELERLRYELMIRMMSKDESGGVRLTDDATQRTGGLVRGGGEGRGAGIVTPTPPQAPPSPREQQLENELATERTKSSESDRRVQDYADTICALEEEACGLHAELMKRSGGDGSPGDTSPVVNSPGHDGGTAPAMASPVGAGEEAGQGNNGDDERERTYAKTVKALEEALRLELNRKANLESELDWTKRELMSTRAAAGSRSAEEIEREGRGGTFPATPGRPSGTGGGDGAIHDGVISDIDDEGDMDMDDDGAQLLLREATERAATLLTQIDNPNTPTKERMTDYDELVTAFLNETSEMHDIDGDDDDDNGKDEMLARKDIVWFLEELRWRFDAIRKVHDEELMDARECLSGLLQAVAARRRGGRQGEGESGGGGRDGSVRPKSDSGGLQENGEEDTNALLRVRIRELEAQLADATTGGTDNVGGRWDAHSEERIGQQEQQQQQQKEELEQAERAAQESERRYETAVSELEASLAQRDDDLMRLRDDVAGKDSELDALRNQLQLLQTEASSKEEKYTLSKEGDRARIRYLEDQVRAARRALTESKRDRWNADRAAPSSSSPLQPNVVGAIALSSSPRDGKNDSTTGEGQDGGGGHDEDTIETMRRTIEALGNALQCSEERRAAMLDDFRKEREEYAAKFLALNESLRQFVGGNGSLDSQPSQGLHG